MKDLSSNLIREYDIIFYLLHILNLFFFIYCFSFSLKASIAGFQKYRLLNEPAKFPFLKIFKTKKWQTPKHAFILERLKILSTLTPAVSQSKGFGFLPKGGAKS